MLAGAGFNPRPASLPGDTGTPTARLASQAKFQSTPGITAGRHAFATASAPRYGRFNPRPASLPGDTMPELAYEMPDWFQSTPGITAGRHSIARANGRGLKRFNPRPASLPGDTWLEAQGWEYTRVSIHARHHCRATRATADDARDIMIVSIHARHHCRATRFEAGRLSLG